MRKIVPALMCLGLAACGNAPGREVTASSIASGILSSVTGGNAPQAPDANKVAQQAAAALSNTSGQVIVVAIPDRDALATMQQIERNGAHVTFGTSDRRSLVLKDGLLTATRGLGHDLMSADVDAVGQLIRARSEGAARRVNRYLDGENLTVALAPWCQVKLGPPARVALGEVDATTATVLESCIAEKTAFQNSYQVTASGRIVQSRQWISPLNGYITIQALR